MQLGHDGDVQSGQHDGGDIERPDGWRGSGILPTGGFRIRDLSISLTGPQKPITAEVRTDTWPHWIAVARASNDQAASARADGISAGPDEDFRRALELEFRVSMTSVCASAFALDAFYGSTVFHAPEARTTSKNRHGTILETLKRAYRFNGEQQNAAHDGLRQIFDLRRKAVHPDAEFEKPVGHPVFGLAVDPRFLWFRMENAITALRIAHQLIWFCLNRPKPQHSALTEWTKAALTLITEPDSSIQDGS